MVVNANDSNFETEVLESDEPVLVDFWAPWCAPCLIMAPIIDEISEKNSDKMKVCKVNVDESPQTASRYGIMSIPTIALFKNGKMVHQVVGAMPKEVLLQEFIAHV